MELLILYSIPKNYSIGWLKDLRKTFFYGGRVQNIWFTNDPKIFPPTRNTDFDTAADVRAISVIFTSYVKWNINDSVRNKFSNLRCEIIL